MVYSFDDYIASLPEEDRKAIEDSGFSLDVAVLLIKARKSRGIESETSWTRFEIRVMYSEMLKAIHRYVSDLGYEAEMVLLDTQAGAQYSTRDLREKHGIPLFEDPFVTNSEEDVQKATDEASFAYDVATLLNHVRELKGMQPETKGVDFIAQVNLSLILREIYRYLNDMGYKIYMVLHDLDTNETLTINDLKES